MRGLAGGRPEEARELAIADERIAADDDGGSRLSFEGRETVAKLEALGWDLDW